MLDLNRTWQTPDTEAPAPGWMKRGDGGFEHQKVETAEIKDFGTKLTASPGGVSQPITHNNGMEIIEIAITIRRE